MCAITGMYVYTRPEGVLEEFWDEDDENPAAKVYVYLCDSCIDKLPETPDDGLLHDPLPNMTTEKFTALLRTIPFFVDTYGDGDMPASACIYEGCAISLPLRALETQTCALEFFILDIGSRLLDQ